MLTDIALMEEVGKHLVGKSIKVDEAYSLEDYLKRVAITKLQAVKGYYNPPATKMLLKLTPDKLEKASDQLVKAWMNYGKKRAGKDCTDEEALRALKNWDR